MLHTDWTGWDCKGRRFPGPSRYHTEVSLVGWEEWAGEPCSRLGHACPVLGDSCSLGTASCCQVREWARLLARLLSLKKKQKKHCACQTEHTCNLKIWRQWAIFFCVHCVSTRTLREKLQPRDTTLMSGKAFLAESWLEHIIGGEGVCNSCTEIFKELSVWNGPGCTFFGGKSSSC